MASWGARLSAGRNPRLPPSSSGPEPRVTPGARWDVIPTSSADAGLTALSGHANRLVDTVGGGSAARRRPPVALTSAAPSNEADKPLRVLIVDDHPLFPELLFRIFHDYDWIEVVGCAANGRDGVMIASATKPDVVLMDIDMPLLDGIEATRRILRRRWTVVIFLTSSASPEDHARAAAAGARVLLPKDTDPERIVAHLRDVYLDRSARSKARHPDGVLASAPW